MWRTSRWSRHALSYNDGGGGTEMRTLALVLAMGFVGAGFSSARAEVKAEVVEYRHGDAVLEGYLAYDAAFAGKRPGVLVVHEWMGHNPYVRKRAGEAGRRGGVDWQFVSYGGAVHRFTNPDAGSDNSKGAAYNERADRRSWEAMKGFFAETLQ